MDLSSLVLFLPLTKDEKGNEDDYPIQADEGTKSRRTYSHKGKTARYAREIAMYLWSKGLSVSLSAVTDYDPARLGEADFLITGCWTCGWFVVGQPSPIH